MVFNDGLWFHDDFPDFKTKDNTKTRKKHLGFSNVFYRESRITSGATKERNEIWKVFVEKAVVEWKEAYPGKEIDPFFKWKVTPFSAEKAETLMHLWDRVSKQIFELVERHKKTGEEKTITIGCHNAVIQVLVMMSEIARGNLEKDSKGLYPMFFERNLLPNGAVAVFEVGDIPDSLEPIKFREFVTAQQSLKV